MAQQSGGRRYRCERAWAQRPSFALTYLALKASEIKDWYSVLGLSFTLASMLSQPELTSAT